MEERKHERKALFTDIILKKMIDDKIKSQKEHDKQKEEALRLAKLQAEKETMVEAKKAADKAAAELRAEEEAEKAEAETKKKGKGKGKGKGGYRKTRKLRQRI